MTWTSACPQILLQTGHGMSQIILIKMPIDLSDFIGENNVQIAFQYYSNTTASADQQEFSIDDINVIATGVGKNFTCDAGGPYSWWWSMQYEYLPNGVRFHGNVTNGTIFTQFLWDFGDGNTSSFHLTQIQSIFITEIGTYNITLTVKDNTFTPPRINVNRTTIDTILTQTTRNKYHCTNGFQLG